MPPAVWPFGPVGGSTYDILSFARWARKLVAGTLHPFEVIVGAILTQNTAWTNVEKASLTLRT